MVKWLEWFGDDCPVPPETTVTVKLRDGRVLERDSARSWDWYWSEDESRSYGDIVAYQVH